MIEILSAKVERWKVDGAFIISRGAKIDVDVVVREVTDGTHVGRGEGTPIYYEGETADLCADSILMRGKQRRKITREDLLDSMMEGAARNALDCALWDLEAKQAGKAVWQLAGLPAPQPLTTAYTVSLGDPAKMEADARAAAKTYKLLKCKLTGEDDRERVAAVRRGAPEARLVVDANESWDDLDIAAEAHALSAFGVELIEPPVSARSEERRVGKECVMMCRSRGEPSHEKIKNGNYAH